MLWQISSGDLDQIIYRADAPPDNGEPRNEYFNSLFKEALEKGNPEKLGVIIGVARLTGWAENTTIEEFENEGLYMSTEKALQNLGISEKTQ